MQYRLNDTLGTLDATKCNRDFGAALSLAKEDLARGAVIDLPEKAAAWLKGKYKGLLDLANVKGIAKPSEVTAPAKSDK